MALFARQKPINRRLTRHHQVSVCLVHGWRLVSTDLRLLLHLLYLSGARLRLLGIYLAVSGTSQVNSPFIRCLRLGYLLPLHPIVLYFQRVAKPVVVLHDMLIFQTAALA